MTSSEKVLLEPLVRVQETCVGPHLIIAGIDVRSALGTDHDECFHALAIKANASIAYRFHAALNSERQKVLHAAWLAYCAHVFEQNPLDFKRCRCGRLETHGLQLHDE